MPIHQISGRKLVDCQFTYMRSDLSLATVACLVWQLTSRRQTLILHFSPVLNWSLAFPSPPPLMLLLTTVAFTLFQFWSNQNAAFLQGTLSQRVKFHNIQTFPCADWPLDINEVETWWTLSMYGARIALPIGKGNVTDSLWRHNPDRKVNGRAKIFLLMPGRVFSTNTRLHQFVQMVMRLNCVTEPSDEWGFRIACK